MKSGSAISSMSNAISRSPMLSESLRGSGFVISRSGCGSSSKRRCSMRSQGSIWCKKTSSAFASKKASMSSMISPSMIETTGHPLLPVLLLAAHEVGFPHKLTPVLSVDPALLWPAFSGLVLRHRIGTLLKLLFRYRAVRSAPWPPLCSAAGQVAQHLQKARAIGKITTRKIVRGKDASLFKKSNH